MTSNELKKKPLFIVELVKLVKYVAKESGNRKKSYENFSNYSVTAMHSV